MFAGTLDLIYKNSPKGDFKAWILYLTKRDDGARDMAIASRYRALDQPVKYPPEGCRISPVK